MMRVVADNPIYSFADFRLDPTRRLLLRNGEMITLHPKAFDLLLTLIENRDRVLSKNELLNSVWEGQFVEEGNLAVQIFTLRKIFAEKKDEHRFIVTIPGKGYRFVADVVQMSVNGEAEKALINVNGESLKSLNSAGISIAQKVDSQGFTVSNRLWYMIFGGLLVFTAAVASGYYLWQHIPPTRKPAVSSSIFRAGSIKRLTTTGNVKLAALSPDGKLFAYTTADFHRQSLRLGYVEGGEHIELRQPAEVSYTWLVFAPDGNSLLYTIKDKDHLELFKLPVFGKVPEKIADSVAPAALSPEGTRIAFVKVFPAERRSSLVVSNIDGSNAQEVLSLPRPHRMRAYGPSWSPDGKMIAYGATSDDKGIKQNVYAVHISDGQVEQITAEGYREILQTEWLSDGSGLLIMAEPYGVWDPIYYTQIWHVSYPDGKTTRITSDLSNYSTSLSLSSDASAVLAIDHRQTMNIWVAPVDKPDRMKQITFGSFGTYDGFTGLAWTPKGNIVFTSTVAHSQVVSETDPESGESRQLTSPGYVNSQLSIPDDGRHIFFHSNKSGSYEIWRMDADGKSAIQLTDGGHNYQSYITPDGSWVYYIAWKDGLGAQWRVPASGGEPQQITKGTCAWASISPDGRFLACDYQTDKGRLAIFPIEGGEPLKQFDFPSSAVRWYGMHWTPDSRAVAYRDEFYGIWKQPIDGDLPANRIEGLPKEKVYRFAWSKDGLQLALVRGTEVRDVVLIESK